MGNCSTPGRAAGLRDVLDHNRIEGVISELRRKLERINETIAALERIVAADEAKMSPSGRKGSPDTAPRRRSRKKSPE